MQDLHSISSVNPPKTPTQLPSQNDKKYNDIPMKHDPFPLPETRKLRCKPKVHIMNPEPDGLNWVGISVADFAT